MSWLASMFGGGKAEKDMDEHLECLQKKNSQIDHKLRNIEMKLNQLEPLGELVEALLREEGKARDGR